MTSTSRGPHPFHVDHTHCFARVHQRRRHDAVSHGLHHAAACWELIDWAGFWRVVVTKTLGLLQASAGVDVTMGNDKAQAGIMPIVPSDFNATKAAAEAAAADYAVVIVYQMTGEV